MKLAYRLELYRSARLVVPVELVRRAEELGYHSVWSAEAYGADALSPLAYLAAHTGRIRLGTAIAQLAARPPATLAMHAMTIDALGGGDRVILGLGVSGPQIVEGWYGQPWGSPHARLRDYVEILRKVLDREGPVTHDGQEISLPYAGRARSARARRSSRFCTRRHGCRSGSPPGDRATPNCAPSSATAGCLWASARMVSSPTSNRWRAGFAKRPDGRRAEDFEIFGR